MKKRGIVFLFLMTGLLVTASSSFGTTLFGPTRYDRTTGAPNVYTDSFTATAGGGRLVIRNGDAEDKHRVTSALIFVNGIQLFGPDDFKQKIPVLEAPVDLADTNELVVELRSKPGTFLTIEIMGETNGLPFVSISADPLTIECGAPSENKEIIVGCSGDYTTLTWNSTNAETCFIEPDVGYVDLNGSASIWIDQTTTFTITATGPGGTATKDVTVTVIYPPPSLWATLDPPEIMVGNKSVLEWESQIADKCVIEPDIGTVSVSGSMYVSPTRTTEYMITATGPGGTTAQSVTLTVNYPPPIVSMQADPPTLQAGESTTLTWDTTYADTCIIDPEVGSVPVDGSTVVLPAKNTTYTLTATGPGGTSTAQTTVYLNPTVTLSADQAEIKIGAPVVLTWQSTDATSWVIEPGNIVCGESSGSIQVFPNETTQYSITATNGGGSTATASVLVKVHNPFTVEITSPIEGALVGRPDVMVEGTILHAGGLETGVVVNGVLAMVYENKFVANHVPLQNAEKTIVVTVTDIEGATVKKAISLNYHPANAYITMKAFPASGLTSFETSLKIDGTFTIPNSTVTDSDPGAVEYLETGTEEYKSRVTGGGFYYFTAHVTDAENRTYTDTVAVLAQDRNDFDAFLKAKWDGMRTGLRTKDVNAAVHPIAGSKKAMYEYNFNLLIDHLPAIEAEFHGITLVSMQDGIVEYVLDSEQEGQRYSFYVLFVKDTDGIWRISFF